MRTRSLWLTRIVALLCATLIATATPARAQLDPLRFLKITTLNVIIAVDTSNRMQRDADGTYYDPAEYSTSSLYTALGLLSSSSKHRRYFKSLTIGGTQNNPTYSDTHVYAVDTTNAAATAARYFYERTRIVVARRALLQGIAENFESARYGLVKTRQDVPKLTKVENIGISDATQAAGDGTGGAGKWKMSRTYLEGRNGQGENNAKSNADSTWTSPQSPIVATDASGSNTTIQNILNADYWASNATWCKTESPTVPCALTPSGKDWTVNNSGQIQNDAAMGPLLDDARAEAARLIAADTSGCRNTVVILVAGGAAGTINTADLAAKASTFANVSGRRVPIFVLAIAPAAGDVAALQAIATNSSGQYFEATKSLIDATPNGNAVAELVRGFNRAVQTAFTTNSSGQEFQTTSPIVGTVNLKGAQYYRTDTGALSTLPDSETEVPHKTTGAIIPQRFNVLVTTGFTLPSFDGRLRALRMYKPVEDSTQVSGWKFTADGSRLWVASTPAADSRNIYTILPGSTTMVPFTTANVDTLSPYMRVTGADASETRTNALNVINYVRSRNLGAVVSSTPAFLDPPSLDPPPDASYPRFRDENKKRRTLLFVGANDGMIHAIDARTGVEVWAFVPFNLLPKLNAMLSGQGVDTFKYYVDSSPKVADVKVDGVWKSYLVFGEGAGGISYNALDVTMEHMTDSVSDTADVSQVLSYFSSPDRIVRKWSFPRNTSFDVSLSTYGDVSASASPDEKTVGQSWSVPAIGQLVNESGPYVVFVGSGFMPHSIETASNRGGARAGRNFYVLDIATGNVLATRDVGSDGLAEDIDNCKSVSNCSQQKNALQMDPVATGPGDSRFVTKAYIGDLDGKVWRFDLSLSGTSVTMAAPVKLYDAGASQPLFSSMAWVNIVNNQYVFVGTGSELLPTVGINTQYRFLVLKDLGTAATKTAELLLERTDGLEGDEAPTGFPAVAGDIVFFSTTTTLPAQVCSPFYAQLYALGFTGGPAYDTNNDGKFTSATSGGTTTSTSAAKRAGTAQTRDDDTLVRQFAGVRATAPFISDQHLVFSAGGRLELFGDPNDFNNGVGNAGAKILSWRLVK